MEACPITTQIDYTWNSSTEECTQTITETQNGSSLPNPEENPVT